MAEKTILVRTTVVAKKRLQLMAAEDGISMSVLVHLLIKAEYHRRHPATWNTDLQGAIANETATTVAPAEAA